jgi:hypothetical protein
LAGLCVCEKVAVAVAVAATEFVWVMSGVSWSGAAPAAALGEVAEGTAPVGPAAGSGSPFHVQFHVQLHEHSWSNENELEAPFEPVHVQFQIQCPVTGDGPTLEVVGELLAAALAAAVCVAPIQDQIHVADPVGASAADGTAPRFQIQSQLQESPAAEITTFVPGSTMLTFTLVSPVFVALADTAFASAVFVCAAFASCPGLPIRTEMFTFVGLLCAAVAR